MMKFSFFVFFFSFGAFAQSNAEIMQKLNSIESRLSRLESKVFNETTDSGSGLKVKNFDGKTVDSPEKTGGGDDSLSPSKLLEIKKTLEDFKKRKEEEKEYLDELVNEP